LELIVWRAKSCWLKLKANKTKEKLYFVRERLGEIFGSRLELRDAWADWVSSHRSGNVARLQFGKWKYNSTRTEREKKPAGLLKRRAATARRRDFLQKLIVA
jgi:hypothetical protein